MNSMLARLRSPANSELHICAVGKDESVLSNFKMYGLQSKYIDVWMGDQMNTALRKKPMFDAIVTDRKSRCHAVLHSRSQNSLRAHLIHDVCAHGERPGS